MREQTSRRVGYGRCRQQQRQRWILNKGEWRMPVMGPIRKHLILSGHLSTYFLRRGYYRCCKQSLTSSRKTHCRVILYSNAPLATDRCIVIAIPYTLGPFRYHSFLRSGSDMCASSFLVLLVPPTALVHG